MTILLVLIPIGLGLLVVAISAFIWAVRNGQFEDLDGEGARILFEEERDMKHKPKAPPVDPRESE